MVLLGACWIWVNIYIMSGIEPRKLEQSCIQLLDDDDTSARVGAWQVVADMMRHVVAFCDSISAEQGIGQANLAYQAEQFDETTQALIGAIKSAFDTNNILNQVKSSV